METDVTFDRLLLEATDLLFQDDLVKAQAKINKALSRRAGEPRALGILAGILSAQGDNAGAAALYRNLLKEFDDEPTLHFKLAMECFALGDLYVGYEEITEAIQCDPENQLLQKFKKHVAYAMGLTKEVEQNPAELPDDLYQAILHIHNKTQKGLERKQGKEKESQNSSFGDPQESPPTPKSAPPTPAPLEEEERTPSKATITTESHPEIRLTMHHSSEKTDPSKGEASSSEVLPDDSEKPIPHHQRMQYIVPNSEGIYTLDPSGVDTLTFSREFLMFPLSPGWYLREHLILCSRKDFQVEHAKERSRGQDNERCITDDLTGRLISCVGQGTAILKPSKNHFFIAFDIHNTPLYIRESMVVAFQSNLKWESGWLRSKSERLAMLSFRGRGKIFLQLSGALFNLEIPDEEFLLTPMEKLVGWEGYVVAQCSQGELVQAAGSGNLFLRD